jgi:hypothetical protein
MLQSRNNLFYHLNRSSGYLKKNHPVLRKTNKYATPFDPLFLVLAQTFRAYRQSTMYNIKRRILSSIFNMRLPVWAVDMQKKHPFEVPKHP